MAISQADSGSLIISVPPMESEGDLHFLEWLSTYLESPSSLDMPRLSPQNGKVSFRSLDINCPQFSSSRKILIRNFAIYLIYPVAVDTYMYSRYL